MCVCLGIFSFFRQHLSCVGFFFLFFYLPQFPSHRNSIALIRMRADAELCNHPLSGRALEVQGGRASCIAISDSPRHLPCAEASAPVSEVV